MRNDQQLSELASLVHGMLLTLHTIGLAYNLRRKNYGAACFHAAAALYDASALARHLAECKSPTR